VEQAAEVRNMVAESSGDNVAGLVRSHPAKAERNSGEKQHIFTFNLQKQGHFVQK